MKTYAYVRVSSKEQNLDRQLNALVPYNVEKKNVFCDYQSGKDFKRPGYKKMIRRMKAGDLLIIKSIDRLGRNYNEILAQWQYITKKIGADILVLDMSLLDTREKDGNLTGVFIADMVLQILAYVAQTEREFIHQRQKEGIAAAKENGRKIGRKRMDMPDEFETICRMYLQGDLTIRGAAAQLGVNYSTFYRRFREFKEKREKECK